MPGDFTAIFTTLKRVLLKHAKQAQVKTDTPIEYTLLTKAPSPYPQHKGQPMYLASVRLGKAYVSFHLMPLYMCEKLTSKISTGLKRRMQGKTCFNFKTDPAPELIDELVELTAAGISLWREKDWL